MSADDDAVWAERAEQPRASLASHLLLDAIDRETRRLYDDGQRATRRRSYVEGSALRYAANRVRRAVSLDAVDLEYLR